MTERTKITLDESEIPQQWYNVIPDLPAPPPPPLHPGTLQPVGPQDLAPLFPMELIRQEVATDSFIDVPADVLDDRVGKDKVVASAADALGQVAGIGLIGVNPCRPCLRGFRLYVHDVHRGRPYRGTQPGLSGSAKVNDRHGLDGREFFPEPLPSPCPHVLAHGRRAVHYPVAESAHTHDISDPPRCP